MSHPVSTRDYGDNEHDPVDAARRISKKRNKTFSSMANIGKVLTGKAKALDRMIKEPASKDWFKRHGTPKFLKDGKGVDIKSK